MHSTWTGGPPRKPSRTSWRMRSASGLNWRLWPTVMRRPTALRQLEQFLGLGRVHREGLLHVDVAAGLQAQPPQGEMRLGGVVMCTASTPPARSISAASVKTPGTWNRSASWRAISSSVSHAATSSQPGR